MQIKFILLIIGFLFVHLNVDAQYENVWAFGDHAGLDFNNGTPVPIRTSIKGKGEANASVCDRNGKLLFYTEGSTVWDRNGNIMPNGTNLTPIVGTFNGYSSTSSSSQGTLIVPIPFQPAKYYIFSLTSWEQGRGIPRNTGKLYYSIVDMHLNGGMGDIVPGKKGMYLDSNLTEKMTAIVGEHCNIWLLTCTHSPPAQFRVYEITATGLDTIPVISSVVTGAFDIYYGGRMAISPDKKKIAITQCGDFGIGANGLTLYDFDVASGSVFNPVQLAPYASTYGVCFSPDNTQLYVSEPSGMVYQYNLNAGAISDIIDSKTFIGNASILTDLKLGPDGKIYLNSGPLTHSSSLSQIEYPNLNGTACHYIPNAITLLDSTEILGGLPNVVPVIRHDTFYTAQSISGACFANVNRLDIHAANDSTGWDYLWNTGATSSELMADTPGTYWIAYHTPPCNFNADTFHVSFPNGVLPDITVDTACINTVNGNAYASTYPGDTVTYHYSWQNQQGDTLSLTNTLQHVPSGNYTLRVTTADCDTILSFYIPEVDYRVSFQADSIVCQETELQFVNTSDRSFTHFLWDFGDYQGSGLRSPGHMYEHSGRYRVMLVGKGEICTDTTNKTITVDSQFAGSFVAAPDSICTGEAITFYPTAKDSTITGLHWQFGDQTEMTSDRMDNKIQHAYEAAGTMPVTLTTQFRACRDTAYTGIIHVYPLPKVYLGPDSGLCLHGVPITLKNRKGISPGVHHNLWNTGDTTEVLKVVHPGKYSLTVSNEPLGCSTTETIKITNDCYIDIPNAFTPNGDGHNDYFFPRQLLSQKIKQFKMQIFNRWGELLFETMNINGRGWDGKFNGKNQSEGVYIYLIDADFANGRKEHYEGNVTLLR